jgi:hypothetical protein
MRVPLDFSTRRAALALFLLLPSVAIDFSPRVPSPSRLRSQPRIFDRARAEVGVRRTLGCEHGVCPPHCSARRRAREIEGVLIRGSHSGCSADRSGSRPITGFLPVRWLDPAQCRVPAADGPLLGRLVDRPARPLRLVVDSPESARSHPIKRTFACALRAASDQIEIDLKTWSISQRFT